MQSEMLARHRSIAVIPATAPDSIGTTTGLHASEWPFYGRHDGSLVLDSRGLNDEVARATDDRRQDLLVPGVPLLPEAVHGLEVDRNPWLIPDHPSVVSRWDLEDVAGTELEFRAIGHLGAQAPWECDPYVTVLTGVYLSDHVDMNLPVESS